MVPLPHKKVPGIINTLLRCRFTLFRPFHCLGAGQKERRMDAKAVLASGVVDFFARAWDRKRPCKGAVNVVALVPRLESKN